MSSMSEIARAKVEAFEAGEEYKPPEPEAVVDPSTEEVKDPPGEPAEPVVDEPEVVEPTEEEEEAAEEAADAAADALGEDATDEERETARQEARDEFYAGTYKTREAAEKGIAEQTLTIDRLFSEKNQLEQRLAQLEEERAAQQKPEEIDLPAWDAWAQQQVAAGAGAAGAQAALEQGGYDGYQLYLRHWMAAETEEGEPDARARAEAVLYNNEVVMSIAEVRAAAAAQRAQAQPSQQEMSEQATGIVKARHPDFDKYVDSMAQVVNDLPEGDIAYLKTLAQGDVQQRARAVELVFLHAKAASPAPAAQAEQVERRRRRASADAATLAATSPTPEGTSSRTPPPAAEAEGLRRKRELRERQNLQPLDE